MATAGLEATLSERGIPCAQVKDTSEVAVDDQALALGIFQSAEHPLIADFKSVAMPFSLSGERPPLRRVPPRLGEHSAEVLAELGFERAQIERLLENTDSSEEDATPSPA
jgi:crotonobetainyl-CoA:carnitine CoA-transferase CaiB-like acyl-CoA transferase